MTRILSARRWWWWYRGSCYVFECKFCLEGMFVTGKMITWPLGFLFSNPSTREDGIIVWALTILKQGWCICDGWEITFLRDFCLNFLSLNSRNCARTEMSWLSSWIHLPTPATARHLLYGIILGFSLSLSSTSLALYYRSRKRDRLVARFDPRPIELRSDEILSGVTGLIGALHH
jgi:hypothetical protein